jgi:hypothetical protein
MALEKGMALLSAQRIVYCVVACCVVGGFGEGVAEESNLALQARPRLHLKLPHQKAQRQTQQRISVTDVCNLCMICTFGKPVISSESLQGSLQR